MTTEQATGRLNYAITKGHCPNHFINSLGKRGNLTQVTKVNFLDQGSLPVDFYWSQVNLGSSRYNKLDIRM